MKPIKVAYTSPYPGFDRDIQRLMRHCPIPMAVRVVNKHVKNEHCGWCKLRSDGIEIVIATGFDKTTTRDTVIHEWAHAVVASSHSRNHKDHGPEWGVAYAQCYRAVVENKL